MTHTTFALVLSGAGVTGVAWETGLLKGLRDAGADLTNADLLVGTSAGSIVGTQIAAGLDLDRLYSRQLEPPDPAYESTPPVNFAEELGRLAPELMAAGAGRQSNEVGLPQTVRALLGRHALESPTGDEAARIGIIASRLGVSQWPERRLLVTAVDVADGQFVAWDRASGVELTRAVASSCAVPMVWPPVTINGRRYMDGGIRSPSNADLATGYERVVIIAPLGSGTPIGATLLKEKRLLESQGSTVVLIEADSESLAAFGSNVLDPARRVPAAEAGLRQSRTAAAALS